MSKKANTQSGTPGLSQGEGSRGGAEVHGRQVQQQERAERRPRRRAAPSAPSSGPSWKRAAIQGADPGRPLLRGHPVSVGSQGRRRATARRTSGAPCSSRSSGSSPTPASPTSSTGSTTTGGCASSRAPRSSALGTRTMPGTRTTGDERDAADRGGGPPRARRSKAGWWAAPFATGNSAATRRTSTSSVTGDAAAVARRRRPGSRRSLVRSLRASRRLPGGGGPSPRGRGGGARRGHPGRPGAERDFTVNAMAVPLGGRLGDLVDPFGGLDDLRRGPPGGGLGPHLRRRSSPAHAGARASPTCSACASTPASPDAVRAQAPRLWRAAPERIATEMVLTLAAGGRATPPGCGTIWDCCGWSFPKWRRVAVWSPTLCAAGPPGTDTRRSSRPRSRMPPRSWSSGWPSRWTGRSTVGWPSGLAGLLRGVGPEQALQVGPPAEAVERHALAPARRRPG